jgi:serine/threonine protein kinase
MSNFPSAAFDRIEAPMTAWASGIQLGPYVLLAPLGSGGKGEVWKARDTRLNRMVAVKRLKDHRSARFKEEAHAIAALNHPHICQIFDIGPDYLVLEYIEGKPLAGPVAAGEAVRLARQRADALQTAHSKGVIHRDVKPANVMVGDKDNEYFSDGLAEEIINVLAQNPGLKVTARTSAFAFRGKEQDIRKIAGAST